MTRCLIQRRTAKTKFDRTLCAGDLVAFDDGSRMIVVTVAHVFKSGTDSGGGMDAYSRLWRNDRDDVRPHAGPLSRNRAQLRPGAAHGQYPTELEILLGDTSYACRLRRPSAALRL